MVEDNLVVPVRRANDNGHVLSPSQIHARQVFAVRPYLVVLSPSCTLSPVRWPLRRPLASHVRLVSNSVSTPRRGQNLTERYRRLHSSQIRTGSVRARTSTTPDTIAGFVIPKEPRAPPDDGVLTDFSSSTTGVSHPIFRVLHAWMCGVRVRLVRRGACCV